MKMEKEEILKCYDFICQNIDKSRYELPGQLKLSQAAKELQQSLFPDTRGLQEIDNKLMLAISTLRVADNYLKNLIRDVNKNQEAQ